MYSHHRAQLARLTEHGLLHRVADGYYIVVPKDMVGQRWIPGLEAAAAGIGVATYGPDHFVVMEVSAARLPGRFRERWPPRSFQCRNNIDR